MYQFKIITTQPKIFDSFLETGLVARGIEKKIIDVETINLYAWGQGKHKSIDDTPYGGGAGMILRVDVMAQAIAKVKSKRQKTKVILLTPQGERFNQKMAKELAKEKGLVLISGRFEGYDERIRALVDKQISIGDYVLMSGDLPAMVLVDAVSRQIPGFIEKEESILEESFSEGLLEYPQYTRPFAYQGQKVPEILLSGNHREIKKWRRKKQLEKTKKFKADI